MDKVQHEAPAVKRAVNPSSGIEDVSGDNQTGRKSATTFVVSTFEPWWDRNAVDRDKNPRPGYKPGAWPVEYRLTWRQLGKAFTHFRPTPPLNALGVADKTALPGWAPVSFANNRRRNENCREISCLVLDFDGGATPDQALQVWSSWPLVWHTSWSHTEEKPKFRIILPLAHPQSPEKWDRIWEWAQAKTRNTIDSQCSDPCRLYFVPAIRPGGVRHAEVIDPGGEMLNLDPNTLPLSRDEQEIAYRRRLVEQRKRRPPEYWGDEAGRRHLRRLELIRNPDARFDLARRIGASISGNRAYHATCPGCGAPEVWFKFSGGWANCNHRNSCGWTGELIELDPA